LEQTDVLCRLIENQYEDIGVPKHNDVRYGRHHGIGNPQKRLRKQLSHTRVEDNMASLKTDIEWHKIDSIHGMG
jgi:hypothetical protein